LVQTLGVLSCGAELPRQKRTHTDESYQHETVDTHHIPPPAELEVGPNSFNPAQENEHANCGMVFIWSAIHAWISLVSHRSSLVLTLQDDVFLVVDNSPHRTLLDYGIPKVAVERFFSALAGSSRADHAKSTTSASPGFLWTRCPMMMRRK
jgi:hypothetical protein